MAEYSVAALSRLTEQFQKLPGIGPKTAARLAYHVFYMSDEEAASFADAINESHKGVCYCKICCNLSDTEICPVCSDEGRDRSTICVVQDTKNVVAFERTGEYNGTYHVLHGVISPLRGVTPSMLRIKELLARLNGSEVKEVIMATNPTIEGEATAVYLAKLIVPMGIKVTRLAYGLPVGADLEYADEVTLLKALNGRMKIE